jgi:lipase
VLLKLWEWGEPGPNPVVCVHGVTQHGRVFGSLAAGLAAAGLHVLAPDLRGHGRSGRVPPWTTGRHVEDLLETLADREASGVTWIGHSFGGRVVASAAVAAPALTERLALLDPGLELAPERCLQGAEIDRLDWSFETPAGAVNALLAGSALGALSRATVAAYVEDDLRRGEDGRYRLSFCPSAVVAAWGEMALPAPPIAPVQTLAVCAEGSAFGPPMADRYRQVLGSEFTQVEVPNGHNVLWEAADETAAAVARFLLGVSWSGGRG